MQTIDINCDLGEGLDNERDLMPYISSCNIACGGHAGTKKTILNIVKLALEYHVKIGAHPSFPDKVNFGRKEMVISEVDLQLSIENQIRIIKKIVEQLGGKLHHVKMHGALYNLSATNKRIAQLIIDAIKNTLEDVFLYVPYNSVIQKLALKNNLKIKIEAFIDRNYNSNLTLVSRKNRGAIITDTKKMMQHLLKMIIEKKVISIDGVEVEIMADTFCVHGDNPNAKKLLKFIHKKLLKNGIKIV